MGVTGDTQTSAAGEETATVQVHPLIHGTVLVLIADSVQKVLAGIRTVQVRTILVLQSGYTESQLYVTSKYEYSTGRRIPHSYMR